MGKLQFIGEDYLSICQGFNKNRQNTLLWKKPFGLQ